MNNLFHAILALTSVCDKVDLSQPLVIAINERLGAARVTFSRVATGDYKDGIPKMNKFLSVLVDAKSIKPEQTLRPNPSLDLLKNNRKFVLITKALFALLNKGGDYHLFEVIVEIKEKKSYVSIQPYPMIHDNQKAFLFDELGEITYSL